MERENIEKLIKVLGIIMLVSLGLKLFGFLVKVIFGITTFLLGPLLVLVLVCGVPILAIYGLYKLVTKNRNKDVW